MNILKDNGCDGNNQPIPLVTKNSIIALIAPDDFFLVKLDTNVSTNPATTGAIKISIPTPKILKWWRIQKRVISIPTNKPDIIEIANQK